MAILVVIELWLQNTTVVVVFYYSSILRQQKFVLFILNILNQSNALKRWSSLYRCKFKKKTAKVIGEFNPTLGGF